MADKSSIISLFIGIYLLSAALSAGSADGVAIDEESFHYRIVHERWGYLGTFSNRIRRRDQEIEVESRLRTKLKFIITLHKERADRKEIWSNGQLVSYESETILNGETIRIKGRAVDGSFEIQTQDGTLKAPPDVFPTNPWSTDVMKAKSVMGTTRGSVVAVILETKENQVARLEDDRSLKVVHLKLLPRGDPGLMPFPQEVWFDQNGIPVIFSVIKNGKRITFTMTNYDEAASMRQSIN